MLEQDKQIERMGQMEQKLIPTTIDYTAVNGLRSEARQKLADEDKLPRNVGLDHVAEGQLKVREQDEWIWQRAVERYEPMVQGVYDGPDPKLAYSSGRKLFDKLP